MATHASDPFCWLLYFAPLNPDVGRGMGIRGLKKTNLSFCLAVLYVKKTGKQMQPYKLPFKWPVYLWRPQGDVWRD